MIPATDVICLVHNNLPVTSEFVSHLEKNTPKDSYRLIFVDNGSTDDVVSFLENGKKSDRWDLIRSDTNLGIINGRNLAATHVKNDYFVNLDNDQHVGDGWLDKLHSVMGRGYDICGTEAWCLLPPNSPHILDKNNRGDYYPFKKCSNKNDRFTYVGCGGMLIKRSVYESIGLFDPRFSPAYFEDPDFCFLALLRGFKIAWAHDVPIRHLSHQTIGKQSLFLKNEQFHRSWDLFKEKWYPHFPEPLQMEKNND